MGYDYVSYVDVLNGLASSVALILAILFIIIILTFVIVTIVALWKVYRKAGKNGWECIIPFYSYYVLTEIAGLNWWWFLLAVSDSIATLLSLDGLEDITSLVSLFAIFNIYYNIAKKFNKSNGSSICAGIFSGIFILIFGFSKKAVYNINIPVSKNGIFGTPDMPTNNYNNQYSSVYQANNISNNVNVQGFSFCGNCGTKLYEDIKFCPNCGKEKR